MSLPFLMVCCHKKAWVFVSLTAPALGMQHRLCLLQCCLWGFLCFLFSPYFETRGDRGQSLFLFP